MSSDDDCQDLQGTFIRHRDRLHAVAFQIVGTHELAEDVLETAHASVVAFLAQPVAAAPYNYCVQIVSQLAIDYRRRESTEQARISPQSLARVQQSLALLSPRALEVFTLYRQGLARRQIARRLHVPVGQVDLMIRDAIEALKACRE